ncbi:MAG TPA: oligosaccharide flippase family protein [Solirubrobacteraceae bacterium]|nr:oligosaccharide flippase family protein [Solirubrobacteraceae bacterium]
MPVDAQDAAAAEETAGGARGLGIEIRRLGGQTLIYGFGGAALQIVGIVTLPILARVFTPTDYGILELGMVVAAILMIVVDGGMASASQRSYFDYGDEQESERRRVLVTALIFQLVIGVLVAVVLAVLAAPISRVLFDGRDESVLIVLVGVALPAFALAQFTREILRLEFRAWSYLVTSLAGAGVAATVTILAVVAWDSGVAGAFIGALCGWIAGAVWGIALVWRRLVARPSRRELAIMLRYGLPLIPVALSLWALSLIDRVMLARLADLDELGQYAIASRLAVPVMLIVMALALALSPFMLSMHQSDPEREKQVRGRVLTDFTAALCLVGLVCALWARELGELVAPDFDEAFRAVGLVAFGLVAFGISSVVVAGISIARQTQWLTLYSAIAALANVGLNLVLIPRFGQVGAATATLFAYLLLTALYYHRAQVLYRTPYRLGVVAATFALGLALMPLGAIDYGNWALASAVKLAALAAFLLALRPIGVVAADDVRRAVAWGRAGMGR